MYWLAAILMLTGCASNAPKLTPEQLKEKRLSTLNIYEDNRVAVRARYSIFINESKDEAAVYSTGEEYFNALDLASITGTRDRYGEYVTFALKDGRKKTFKRAGFSALWCNRDKICRSERNGGMKIADLNEIHGAPKRDPSFDIKTRGAAPLGNLGAEDRIQILSGKDYNYYTEKIDDYYARWPDVEKKIIAELKAREQAIANIKERMRNAPKGTKEFCGGRQLDGNPGDARKAGILSFDCTKYGQQRYMDMVDAGWVIINVNTRPIIQFGQQAIMYDVTMEKQ